MNTYTHLHKHKIFIFDPTHIKTWILFHLPNFSQNSETEFQFTIKTYTHNKNTGIHSIFFQILLEPKLKLSFTQNLYRHLACNWMQLFAELLCLFFFLLLLLILMYRYMIKKSKDTQRLYYCLLHTFNIFLFLFPILFSF